MQKLFRNANIVNIKNDTIFFTDIIVEDGKIKSFCKPNTTQVFDGEIIDLNGDFVLPPFVNVFCDSYVAFNKNYDVFVEKSKENLLKIQNLMKIKNLFAGAILNDVADINQFNSKVLDEIENKSEKELSELANNFAKAEGLLFIKGGQSLDELGTIDLQYKMPLPQLLEDFGFLDREPILIGGNCFEKDDFELFSQYGCSFCLTVSEDGKDGRRPTNIISLLAKEFDVGIGSGYSFEVDFFGFMRQMIMTQRGLFEDVSIFNEKDAFEISTFKGAEILKLENYGLEEGCNADFIVVSKTDSLYDSTLKTLVWEKTKKDILLMVSGGEILMKNGKIFMNNMPDYDTILLDIKQNLL